MKTDANSNAYLLLGAGSWEYISSNEGWRAKVGHRYCGEVALRIKGESAVKIFCLMYDRSGRLMDRRLVGQLSERVPIHRFGFKTRPTAERFDLAIYVAKETACRVIGFDKIMIEEERFELVYNGLVLPRND